MKNAVWINRLVRFAVVLACCVVALGAYTRLKDAGLGCPDWPGCYGHVTWPKSEEAIAAANQAFPHRPVEGHKAWPEMVHRYFASTLGLVILIMTVLAFRARQADQNVSTKLPVFLLCLVTFQGILGMWTVTLGLFPTVVMGHLLGGFTTLSMLFLFALIMSGKINPPALPGAKVLFGLTMAGIVILILQIALGGWTAANYAAAVCAELPICQSGWQDELNLSEAFTFWGHGIEHKGLQDYEYGHHLSGSAKITIHVAHRIGAIITTVYLGLLLGWLLFTDKPGWIKRIAGVALAILTLQIVLGVSNILYGVPLAVAVAHNGVAALLLLSLIWMGYSLYKARGEQYG
ncbi:MAG: COX15/CtaA family protein [Ketobacteraceae bacterium]|nr:COX15/CtaA family protein [Ketobacteraceae bacterium]